MSLIVYDNSSRDVQAFRLVFSTYLLRITENILLISSDGVEYSTSEYEYEYRKKLRVRVRVLILKNVLEYEYRKKVRVRVRVRVLLQV